MCSDIAIVDPFQEISTAIKQAIDSENERNGYILPIDYLCIEDCRKTPIAIKINTVADNLPQAQRVIKYWRKKLEKYTTIKAKLYCPIRGGGQRFLFINNVE